MGLTPELALQLLVSGLGMGMIFALIATGLTVIYGVMNVVNFAHGEFLMVAMFGTIVAYNTWGLDPLVSLPIVTVLMFVFGVVVYALLIRRVLGKDLQAQIFATFGLMVFLQAGAQFIFGADYNAINDSILGGTLRVGAIALPLPQVAAGVGALLATALLTLLIYRTGLGRKLRAVSQDREAAITMGIDVDRMNALAWGLGSACVGVAGSLLANFYYVFPRVGAVFVLVSYVVVALGGFGSIGGALLAGVIVGVLQVISGFLLPATVKFVPVYALFLLVALLRPNGLLGRRG